MRGFFALSPVLLGKHSSLREDGMVTLEPSPLLTWNGYTGTVPGCINSRVYSSNGSVTHHFGQSSYKEGEDEIL